MYSRAASQTIFNVIKSTCFVVLLVLTAKLQGQQIDPNNPPPANQDLPPAKQDDSISGQQQEGMGDDQDNAKSEQNQDNEELLPPLGPTLNTPGTMGDQNQDGSEQQSEQPDIEPPVFVNEEFAGWRQAANGLGGLQVSETLRANWVMLGPNGKLSGQVLTFDGTTFDGEDGFVVHLVQKGETIASGRTDESGRFEINGIEPGTYTITGISFDNFFAFGFNAIGFQDGASSLNANIQCIAIPRFGTLLTDLVKQNAPKVKFRVYGQYKFEEGDDDPARLLGLDGIALRQPEAVSATSIQAHRVAIEPNGSVFGRIHQIHNMNGRPVEVKDTNVYLIRENVILARAKTNYYGVFEFRNVQPGFYGVIAAGRDGFAALAVEIVPSLPTPETGLNHPYGEDSPSSFLASITKRLTNNAAPITAPFDVTLIASENIGWLNRKIHDRTYAEALADDDPKVWRPAYWAIDEGFKKIRPEDLMRPMGYPGGICQPQYPGGGWAYGPICESDYWVGGGYGYGGNGNCGFGYYHGFGYTNAFCNQCAGNRLGYGGYGLSGCGYGGCGYSGWGYGGWGYGVYGSGFGGSGFSGYGYGGYGYGGSGSGGGTIFDFVDSAIEQYKGLFGRRSNYGSFGGLTPQDFAYFSPRGTWNSPFARGIGGMQGETDPLQINRGPFNQPNPDRKYWERDPRTRIPVDPRLIGNQNPNAPENIRKRQEQIMRENAEKGILPSQYDQNQMFGPGGGYPGFGMPYRGYGNGPMGGYGYGYPGYGNPQLIDYRVYQVPTP